MKISTQAEAQKRADEIRLFRQELDRLEQEGVLTFAQEQKQAVTSYHAGLLANLARSYDIDRSDASRQLSMGMRVASFLGALALAASVFFLFYQFWGKISTPAQVGTLVFAPLGALLGTLWIQEKDATGYFTKLAAMVAFACYVLDITMLGQIFNITPSDNAFIAWAAFSLLLAYACQLRLLLAAGILCLIAFVSARTGTWSGMYWLDFGRRPENFFPAAFLLFLVAQLVPHRRFDGFAPLYRIFSLLALFLPMLVLSNWGDGSYLELDPTFIQHSYQVAGFLFSAGTIWLGVRRNWPEVLNTGVTFFVIFLYTKFYDWWWDSMPKYLFFLILGLTAVLILLILRRLRVLRAREVQ